MRVFLEARAAACAAMCACAFAMSAAAMDTSPAASATSASGSDPFRAAEVWAFPKPWSPDPSAPDAKLPQSPANTVLHVPGSTRSYTWGELDGNFVAPDWFPQDHPPAPHVVLFGRKPAWACGACHYPNGEGDVASPTLAGLPKAYILEQIKALRDGQRVPADPEMAEEACNLDDADLQQAADYFSGLKFRRNRRVVETTNVQKTHWEVFVRVPDTDGAREPIGARIIELSNNHELYNLGGERAGFTAYVPLGSIQRGAGIAEKGKGSVAACEACHGAQLQGQTLAGIGIAPPLAGRSPTYLVKELILFREGKRSDPAAAPMVAEASALTVPEMIDVAAYAGSRTP